MSAAEIAFWIASILILYTYVGYPALIWIWATLFPWAQRTARSEPLITIVIVAYNEGQSIEARLENLLAQDYPRDCREIFVASDGSTDDTVERAQRFEPQGVRVLDFSVRRGKPAVLNAVVPDVPGDIVVLADARQYFHQSALRALVGHFADPNVGAVSGELILTSNGGASGATEGVGIYWNYEKFIRRHESMVDSTPGATGAIYAIRHKLFEPIRDDTLLDDVLIPMQIVRRGFRVLFDPNAVAYDRMSATPMEEFRRKVRTIAGNFQLLLRERWLLNPLRNRIWVQMLSHKALRLLIPFGLAMALVTNLMLLEEPLFQWFLGGQMIFYTAALIGLMTPGHSRSYVIFNAPYAFCLLNWAVAVALVRIIRGQQQVTWNKGSG